MLNLAFSLRYIMFVASLGAAMGALVMLWEGCVKLFGALRVLGATGDEGAGTVIGFVMGATDEFLFALVLLIFAYAIAFGFVIDLAPEDRERLPAWMRISSISELKHTLIEVILVYLVVDFATDIAQESGPHHHEWSALVLPASDRRGAAARVQGTRCDRLGRPCGNRGEDAALFTPVAARLHRAVPADASGW